MSNSEHSGVGIKLEPGTIVDDRYEILGVLGRGGFATVYRAKQIQLHQEVALKILQVGEDFRERFYREAKTAASIKHPDIVTIYDYGVINDEYPYMVMEMLSGRPLDVELRKNGGMEVTRARRLFVRCLDALQAAHDKEIIHRDLKPANLFLTGAGTRVETLRILDFGIALMLSEDTRLTSTGQLFGTPRYLAPEYIQKNVVTPALDVYQMGLIFVELLTGRNIIEADNNYTFIFAHCNGEINVPKQLMDSPLGPVIARALSTDHTTRFASAGEFGDALDAVDLSSIEGRYFRLPKKDKDGVEPETMIIIRDYVPPEVVGPALSGEVHKMERDKAGEGEAPEPGTVQLGRPAAPDKDEDEEPRTPTQVGDMSAQDLSEAQTAVLTADDPDFAAAADASPEAEDADTADEGDADKDSHTRPFSPPEVEPRRAEPDTGDLGPDVSPPPGGGGSKTGLVIGAVAVVVILGVVIALVAMNIGGPSEGEGEADGGLASAAEVGGPAVDEADGASDSPAAEADAEPAEPLEADANVAPPEPEPVEVEVKVEPTRATLSVADAPVGEGGVARLTFESSEAEAKEVCAEARGYVKSCRTVVPADAPTLTLTLERRERRRRTGGGNTDKPPKLELPE